MVNKKSTGDYIFDTFNYIFLSVLALVTLYPFIHVICGAISGPGMLIGHKGALLWPLGTPTLKAFGLVFRNPNILTGYRNTVFVLVTATALNILMTSLGAYVCSRQQFAIRNALMFMIIFTMYFGGGMIPRYLFLKNYLGMGDHLWSLIIPGAISAYNLIIMRNAFSGVPAAASPLISCSLSASRNCIISISEPPASNFSIYYNTGAITPPLQAADSRFFSQRSETVFLSPKK